MIDPTRTDIKGGVSLCVYPEMIMMPFCISVDVPGAAIQLTLNLQEAMRLQEALQDGIFEVEEHRRDHEG